MSSMLIYLNQKQRAASRTVWIKWERCVLIATHGTMSLRCGKQKVKSLRQKSCVIFVIS